LKKIKKTPKKKKKPKTTKENQTKGDKLWKLRHKQLKNCENKQA
jgi:hypothetical protein